jgi:uncharacterized protein (DUF2249 family)
VWRSTQQIAAQFAAHAAKENDLLLPTLVADQSVDLPALLGQMHEHGDAGQDECHHHALAGPDLDVRDLPPARRHATIFDACQALLPGAGLVLINDHDPKPLRYQFEAEHPGEFTWDYLQAGPDVWRVRIGRAA